MGDLASAKQTLRPLPPTPGGEINKLNRWKKLLEEQEIKRKEEEQRLLALKNNTKRNSVGLQKATSLKHIQNTTSDSNSSEQYALKTRSFNSTLDMIEEPTPDNNQELKKLREEKQLQAEELEKLKIERDSLAAEVEKLHKDHHEKTCEISQLKHDNSTKDVELLSLKGQLETLKATVGQLEEDAKRFKESILENKEEIKPNGLVQTEIDVERLKKKILRQKEKYQTVKTELSFKVTLVDGLQSTITQMQELNHGVLSQLEEERRHTQRHSEKARERKEKLKLLEATLKDTESKVDRLRKKLKDRNREREKDTRKGSTKKLKPEQPVDPGKKTLSPSKTMPEISALNIKRSSSEGKHSGSESKSSSNDTKHSVSDSKHSSNDGKHSRVNSMSEDAIKKLKVNSAQGDFELKTNVSAFMTIGEIIARLQKKFPGTTDSFALYAPTDNSRKSWFLLEKDRTLSSYGSNLKLVNGMIPVDFDNPIFYQGKGNKNLKKVLPGQKDETKPQQISLLDAIQSGDVSKIRSQLTKEEILRVEGEGFTPMNDAIMTNNFEMIDFLLNFYKTNGLKLNAKDRNGWTALHCAVFNCTKNDKDEEILRRIIDFPGIQVDAENADKNTPLHYFATHFLSPSCQEIGLTLIQKAPSTVNARNSNGETPLHKAIFNQAVRLLMVSMLIDNGADTNIPNQRGGETVLHYAVRLGRKDIVKLLLHAGANIGIKEFRENKTPYDLAVEDDQNDIAETLKDVKELSDWLKSLRLDEFYPKFLKEDVTLRRLAELDEKQLEALLMNMKIDAMGVRIRMLKACTQLREKTMKQSLEKRIKDASKRRPSWERTPRQKELIDQFKKGMVTTTDSVWLISDQSELEFTKELGSGSNGKVYKGIYKDTKVAIKVLKAVSNESLEGFKKEFAIMSIVQSKNIVHFFGASLEPKVCMVLEYCSKGSLYKVLKDEKNVIDWGRALTFAIDMASGMNCLHTWDPPVFHRDMKSPNLLVNEEWIVKVCDMGLARFNTPDQEKTMGKLCGTYAYLAPEIFFGERFEAKADVFSMGIILWELAVRVIKGKYEVPYEEFPDLRQEFLIAIKVAETGRRPTIPASCPPPWSDLLRRCLEHNPADRPTTSVMLKELEEMNVDFQSDPEKWGVL